MPSPKALLDVMVENIIVEGYGQRERPDRLPAREASSTHGHVSGGKRQGLEAGWMYEEGPMWWLRATSCPAPHPGSEDLPRCHLRLRWRQWPARRGVEAATRDHRGSHGQWHLVWREPAARLRVIVLGDLHRALRPFLPVQPVQPVQSSAAAAASRPHSSADSDSDDSACSRRPLHDGANQPPISTLHAEVQLAACWHPRTIG
jgi:hypothetical protein